MSELENGSNFHVRFDDSEHNFELKVSLITVHFCVHLHEVVGSDRRYTLLATGVNFLTVRFNERGLVLRSVAGVLA